MVADATRAKSLIDRAKDQAGTAERDPVRAMFRYHQTFADPVTGRTLTRKLIYAAIRVAPYAEGIVRPHLASEPARRDAAIAELKSTRTQSVPVLASFKDPPMEVERLFRKTESERSILDHVGPDGVVHRIWRVRDASTIGALRTQFGPRKLTILDGHEYYEAAQALEAQLDAERPLLQYASPKFALGCLVNVEDQALTTIPRHRIIRGGPPIAEALVSAKKFFIIESLPAAAATDYTVARKALEDTLAHQPSFVLVAGGQAHKLTLSPDISVSGEGVAVHRSVQKFDPVVADELFVGRCMPGAKIETTIDAKVALGAKGDAALIMRPLTIEQVRQVVEIGEILPAGSSAFYPPLVPGLLQFIVDPDEDLV